MTIRSIGAAVLTASMLMTGASFAATESAGNFTAQLNEAKVASLTQGDPDTRGTVVAQLSTAEHLYEQGQKAQAQQYLRFARGMLGLSGDGHAMPTQLGGSPDTASSIN
jgi:hypothetical protein